MTEDLMPAEARYRMACALRAARVQAGMTAGDVARRLRWSGAKVSRIESMQTNISYTDMQALLLLYGRSGTEVAAMAALHDMGRATSPYSEFRDIAEPDEMAYLEATHRAVLIRQQCGWLIPPLLQTEDYASSLFRSGALGQTSPRRRRLQRLHQRLLNELGGLPPMTLLVDETMFHRRVGSVEVMADQLRHLLEFGDQVEIRMVPFASYASIAMLSPHTLITGPEDTDDMLCINSFLHTVEATRDPLKLFRYNGDFDILLTNSTKPSELIGIIEWALANLREERPQFWRTAA